MTTSGGDPRVLSAASRIHDTYTGFGTAGRRVVDNHLSHYPALATDPRLAGPLLADFGPGHRRAVQLFTVAGGEDLQHAARRLAEWAGPAVTLTHLEHRLEGWLPDAVVEAPAVRLTRRLLCDAAGLATTAWSTNAASVVVLETFARTAIDLADDAELINEDALRHALEHRFDDAVVEALGEVCGFERLFGSLAVRRNRFSLSKAALLDLGRSASRHEIAELTGLTAEQVGMALSTCASIVRTGYNRWATHRDPRFVDFAAAVADAADDVGLIDEPHLAALASKGGFSDRVDGWIAHAGYVRLNEQLAMSGTHTAKVKAAVKHHGDSAPIEQVAETAGLTLKAAAAAARNTESVRLTKGTCRIVAPDRPPLVELARAHADDVGLVDVDAFAAAAATHDYPGTTHELTARCGLVGLFGSFALKDTTAAATKAALLSLQHPATLAELATLTNRTPKAVTHALTETPSIVQTGRRWAINTCDGSLGRFAAAAAAAADDVGLVNEPGLRSFAAGRGWSDRFDELTKACGLERVEGRLALDNTTRAALKAALLNAGRPATSHEIAANCGLNAAAVATALRTVASVTRVRPSLWVPTDLAGGVYARFGAALRLCSDDVGLIDEPQLREAARQQRWDMPVDELVALCGLPRLHGTLAMDDTAAAAAKAALLALGRPATLHELADITGYKYGTLRNALARVDSVQRTSRGTRPQRGLLAVRDPADTKDT